MRHGIVDKFVEFAIAHPVIGGVAFVIMGAWMAFDGINEGTAYAQFTDGATVIGRVSELINHNSIPMKYQMVATWRDESGKSFTGTVDLGSNDFETLSVGHEIPLLISKLDHSRAMVAKYYENNKPVTIGGVSATGIVFFGIGTALTGVGLAVFGRRKKEAPAPPGDHLRMHCPVCGTPLLVVERDSIKVDYCINCHGIWFDQTEIELLGEKAGVAIGTGELEKSAPSSSNERYLRCPRCGKKMRKADLYGEGQFLIVDFCRLQHGLWFDRGETGPFVRSGERMQHRTAELITGFLGETFDDQQRENVEKV
ncbi:MAG TPA: zf-TFIIB domain-containing protein [Thermoanaerobaculia bacterium]|nr:zf-TFIIB domain-containing protein [Thermoanaerobaculia bacterium]